MILPPLACRIPAVQGSSGHLYPCGLPSGASPWYWWYGQCTGSAGSHGPGRWVARARETPPLPWGREQARLADGVNPWLFKHLGESLLAGVIGTGRGVGWMVGTQVGQQGPRVGQRTGSGRPCRSRYGRWGCRGRDRCLIITTYQV